MLMVFIFLRLGFVLIKLKKEWHISGHTQDGLPGRKIRDIPIFDDIGIADVFNDAASWTAPYKPLVCGFRRTSP